MVTSTAVTSGELSSASVVVRQLRIVFGRASIAVGVIPLAGDRIAIGRDASAPDTIAIRSDDVSRHHATLVRIDDTWTMLDEGSRNGTWVDGLRVARAPVRHGTVIRIGPVILVCEDAIHELAGGLPPAGAVLGQSLAIWKLRGEVDAVAESPLAVLIEGETGVGKELVASALHQASGRTGALVPVNCAALPPSIADSELFGHVSGAFTGAGAAALGLFTAAKAGTIFLDEVGELPPEVQAKLLRALASQEVRPVGASEPIKVDVRVVAATHRDLDAEVAAGRFRADLLARLGGWRIRVPPLRERRDDVLLLAGAFLVREGGTTQLSAHAAEALVLHDWPYNVRELEQVMRAASVRAGAAGPVRVDHLPDEVARRLGDRITRTGPARLPLAAQIDRSQPPSREILQRALDHHGGSVAETARFFGKDRRQIYRWADRLGVALRREDLEDS